MDYIKLWSINVCIAVGIIYYPEFSLGQGACSPRCWTLQSNASAIGGFQQSGVASEEVCKEICLNTAACIGIDWDKSYNTCWFQTTPLSVYDRPNINHWSLTNCTDQCVSYCWETVKVDYHEGLGVPVSAADENHCKLTCSTLSNCTGVDWNATSASCCLIFNATLREPNSGIRHWDIIRNLPTHCQSSTSPTFIVTSNTLTPPHDTTNTLEDLSNPTESLPERANENSDSLKIGIIVLAVLLGLCLLIIIIFIINTVRIVRQLHLKSEIKSVELNDNNYEGLQRAETKSISDATYTDLVKRNSEEAVHVGL